MLYEVITNPKEERMMDAFRAALVLLGKDERAEEYIVVYGGAPTVPLVPKGEGPLPGIRERLSTAVIEGDRDGIPA